MENNLNQDSDILKGELNDRQADALSSFLRRLLGLWPLFLLTLFFAIGGAWLFLFVTPKEYRSELTLFVKPKSSSGVADLDMAFEGLGISKSSTELENELIFLESRRQASNTLAHWGVKVLYRDVFGFRSRELYQQTPIKIVLDEQSPQFQGWRAHLSIDEGSVYVDVKDEGRPSSDVSGATTLPSGKYPLNTWIVGSGYRLKFTSSALEAQIEAEVLDLDSFAEDLRDQISISPYSKESMGLRLALVGYNPQMNEDLLNSFAKVYQNSTLFNQYETADRTLVFIEQELTRVKDSLNRSEVSRQQFLKLNGLFDLSKQGGDVLNKLAAGQEERAKILLELNYLDHLSKQLSTASRESAMFAAFSLSNPTLNALLENYRVIQMEEGLMSDLSASNPARARTENKLMQLKNQLEVAIQAERSKQKITLQTLEDKARLVSGEVAKLPETEREFIAIQRSFTLNQEIYNFLLQREAAVAINRAGLVPNSRLVDEATTNYNPVNPRPALVWTLAINLALFIPVGFLFAKDFFDNKVHAKEHITTHVPAPIIGLLGHNKGTNDLAVFNSPRSSLAESFRSLNVMTKFLAPDQKVKVYTVCSMISGEGKSFVALNFASTLALSGARVLLVGLDLRKPKLFNELGLNNSVGMSTLLSGQSVIQEVIQASGRFNLDLVPAGPVPPNPSELIASEVFELFMQEVNSTYDFVIIDTPPLGLISDGFTIAKFVDVNIVVVRQDYSLKQMMPVLGDYIRSNRLQRVGIVVNDIAPQRGYGQGYGYAYGYGYGYTYGSKDRSGYYIED
jgi:tyrosine-protein kinase Etk/Wzc